MTSPENKPSNDSSVIKDASSTANYPDKKAALTDVDDSSVLDSSVLDSTVEHTESSKSSEIRDDNDCGEDMACAQPPETTIAIKSIGADEVVATLETAQPNNESETTKLEITGLETPLSNESLKSTTAPNHKNLENVSAEHAQAEEDNAEVTVEAEDSAPLMHRALILSLITLSKKAKQIVTTQNRPQLINSQTRLKIMTLS